MFFFGSVVSIPFQNIFFQKYIKIIIIFTMMIKVLNDGVFLYKYIKVIWIQQINFFIRIF